MILITTDVENSVILAYNGNDFPVHLNYASHGFPEHGIYLLDAGEYLELNSFDTDERPIGYQRQKADKIPCEVSKPPATRKFEQARANGNVDWMHSR